MHSARKALPRPLGLGVREFVALAAAMMGMLALSIDVVLPALAAIGAELRVAAPNQSQYVVSVLILGVSVGQVLYGPLAERFGRKPPLLGGLLLFGAGCLTSALATDLRAMLAGRFLQGLGAAGPRIVTLALVRDQYSGTEMARVMSLILAVLMVGPLLAPFLGQGLLFVASWRVVFLLLLVFDLAIAVWLIARQPETLPVTRRMSLWRGVGGAVREVCGSRAALGYAVAAGIVFGELFAYVTSAQQIYQVGYGVGAWFPLCFCVSGVSIAAASVLNERLVSRFGMRRLSLRAGLWKALIALLFLAVARACGGTPPLGATLALVSGVFFCAGVLFGNLNALAMERLGHVAGVAAGVVGSVTWLLAVALATLIGQRFDGTVVPLASGLSSLSVALLVVLRLVEVNREDMVRAS